MTTILAIDPGLSGAFAVLRLHTDTSPATVECLFVEDLPVATAKVNGKDKSHLLISTLAQRLEYLQAMYGFQQAVIEEVGAMPGQGVTSMFRFGYVAGSLAGVTQTLKIPTTFIRPLEWQKWAGVRKGEDAGRLRANQVFPRQAPNLSRKKDHNRADAMLIGYGHLCKIMGKILPTPA